MKSRTLAAAVVEDGKVRRQPQRVSKAQPDGAAGDVLTSPCAGSVQVLKVLAPGARRGPPTEARLLYEDLSRHGRELPGRDAAGRQRDRGSGRPTKRDRRLIDRLDEARLNVLGSARLRACDKRATSYGNRAPLAPVARPAADRPSTGVGKPMTYIVNENCIKCKFTDCVEVCPVDCFYEGENMLVIHPDECIDCGVCEPECPVDAIKPDTEPGLEKWLELNRAVFREMAEYHLKERGAAGRG